MADLRQNNPKHDQWGFPESWTLERKVRDARSGLAYFKACAAQGALTPTQQQSRRIYIDFLDMHGDER